MPFHDWTDRSAWYGMRQLWIAELFRWSSAPGVAVGAPEGRPDAGAHQTAGAASRERDSSESNGAPALGDAIEPEIAVAVMTLDPGTSLCVEKQGRLIAAVELLSPRNKDRPDSRADYLARSLAYLHQAVHLLMGAVHRRPIGFSFADRIAAELSIDQEPLPPPFAVSDRVGEPAATGGRYLASWHRALTPGSDLPTLPLPLDVHVAVPVALELTYSAAAIDAEVE